MTTRHYLWYDADGKIGGRSKCDMGFGDECDPSDPDTTDQGAINLRTHFLSLPNNFINCIAFECPCVPQGSANMCSCDADCCNESYVDLAGTPTLTAKPTVQFVIDDAPAVDMAEEFLGTPGTSITFKIEAAVPEGHQVQFKRNGNVIILSDPLLTFTAGVSDEITLVYPAQGTMGLIYGVSKHLRYTYMRLRGWA